MSPTTNDIRAEPWGIVGGLVHEGRILYLDAAALSLVATPRAVTGRQIPRTCHKAVAAPGGRFVVYSGHLLVDDPRYEQSEDLVTAIHDLHHPLSWVNRPPATFSNADLHDLTALLDRSGAPEHTLAPDERQVLELVRDAAAHHLSNRAKTA